LGNEILRKIRITPDEFDIWVKAPEVSENAKPGQFVIIRVDESGERIPLTIADTDPISESIRLIYQVVGASTLKLSKLNSGDKILNLAGPLGRESELTSAKKVIVAGGGVGIAAILPIIKGLKKNQNEIYSIIGAKTKEYLILKNEIREFSDFFFICTDDGSEGEKGFVTNIYNKLLKNENHGFDASWAVGPTVMMKALSEIAVEKNILLWTSLNPIMVDGTGMCGGCRVKVRNTIKFACVDGPEFDGRFVDWNSLLLRQKQFTGQEKESFSLKSEHGGGCRSDVKD